MNAFSQIGVYELSAPLNGAMSMTAQDVNAPRYQLKQRIFFRWF